MQKVIFLSVKICRLQNVYFGVAYAATILIATICTVEKHKETRENGMEVKTM